MEEVVDAIIKFLTTILWLDLILSFFSKTINNMLIEELQKQNEKIDRRRTCLKKLFVKVFIYRFK